MIVRALPTEKPQDQAEKEERDRAERAKIEEKLALETQRIADQMQQVAEQTRRVADDMPWLAVVGLGLAFLAAVQTILFVWLLVLVRRISIGLKQAAEVAESSSRAAIDLPATKWIGASPRTNAAGSTVSSTIETA